VGSVDQQPLITLQQAMGLGVVEGFQLEHMGTTQHPINQALLEQWEVA